MKEINNLIEIKDLQIGDEVIVRGIDLNYMKMLRLPKPKTHNSHGYTYDYWGSAKCKRMNNEKLNCDRSEDSEVYFDFSYKKAWLVKRSNEN
jgi:hypothetical protein